MRHLRIALGLVVVGLMAVTASPALAAQPEWIECFPNSGHGEWKNKTCTESGSGGGWETKALTGSETLEVTSTSTGLTFTDTKATGGETSINCTENGTGWVSPKGKGAVTLVTLEKCSFVEKKDGACEESTKPVIKAVNLPWHTRLEEIGGEARDNIENGGKGLPGFATECEVDKILKISDECTGTTSTGMKNARTTGTVELKSDEKSAKGTCTDAEGGEKETGVTKGTVIGSADSKVRSLLGFFFT
jgi:hypothetical protein